MSELTLAQLANADSAPFHAAAAAWQGLADALDTAADELIDATRDLPYAWERGPGAEACWERTGKVKGIVNEAYTPPHRVAQALTKHAHAVAGVRALLLGVVEAAGTITAIGHSYGSTVVAEAGKIGDGRQAGFAVNDIVVAGSPGMHADHASELNLDSRHVWVGQADDDSVADENFLTGWGAYGHGDGVAEPGFGANHYVTDTKGHGAYWDYKDDHQPTESLANQARVVMGEYRKVGLVRGKAPGS